MVDFVKHIIGRNSLFEYSCNIAYNEALSLIIVG